MTAARSHTAEDTAAHALAAGNATLSYEGAGRRKLPKKKKKPYAFLRVFKFSSAKTQRTSYCYGSRYSLVTRAFSRV